MKTFRHAFDILVAKKVFDGFCLSAMDTHSVWVNVNFEVFTKFNRSARSSRAND